MNSRLRKITLAAISLMAAFVLLSGGVLVSADGGNLDPTFDPAPGPNFIVDAIAVQPDGKVVIGGLFTSYNGVSRNRIARVNADGSLDTTFNPGTGANNNVYAVVLQPDGKILIGGAFTTYNGTSRRRIARLNADGSLDTTFNPGTGADASVRTVALQPDGKIIIGGSFTNYNGAVLSGSTFPVNIGRLNSNGSLDSSFVPPIHFVGSDTVYSVVLQPDGKVIIAGGFRLIDGTERIARLNSDGSRDATFNPGTSVDQTILSASLQPDGKIVIGGYFTSYNGTARNRVARVNADGSLDATFNPGAGADSSVFTIALQSDGKVLAGGFFSNFNGAAHSRIVRLNADGSVDASFNPSPGPNNSVYTITQQPDGKLLVGGEFNFYSGAVRLALARLLSQAAGAGTTVSGVLGGGVYDGPAILTATLSSGNTRLSGKVVTFALGFTTVGTAVTDSNGVATLPAVSLSGRSAGTYANAVGASFAGDASYSGSGNTGTVTIDKATPVINWVNPSNIVAGTALGDAQLNATAYMPGTFQYSPPAGTVLSVGTHQMSVTFTPTDTSNFTTATKSVQITVDPEPGVVQLSQTSYTVAEGARFGAITVTRSGDTSGAAAVKYQTSDATDVNFRCDPTTAGQVTGIASRKCDYHIASGRLRFNAGESSKTIILSVVNDGYVEGPETFTLTLSSPVGMNLVTNTSATVIITDDDVTPTNPIDGTRFYVRQLYVDLLSREPDQAGWDGWTNRIDLCGQPGQAPPPCDRVTVGGDGFLRSSEFFDRQFFVLRLYKTAFGRILQYSEVGDLAYVSGFLSSADLELNKQDLVAEIMSRSEFKSKYDGLGDAGFVDTLLQTAGITVPRADRDAWVLALGANTKTQAQVFREISERPEVSAKHLTEAQVVSAYYGFFTRNPDGAYTSYLNRLNSGEINLGDLANAFINAQEYRQRFGF